VEIARLRKACTRTAAVGLALALGLGAAACDEVAPKEATSTSVANVADAPNVVGQKLDVAEKAVKAAGFASEVEGGGTFGVVVESNWTVCEQRPKGDKKIVLVVDRECSVGVKADSTTTTTTAAVITPTTAPLIVKTPTTPKPYVPPTTQYRPPATSVTTQPSNSGSVHPGAYCSGAGTTGYSENGVPMTCSEQSCTGDAYDHPRWRKTTC
jgi:hypothetical protein